jgi:hypothetical protein
MKNIGRSVLLCVAAAFIGRSAGAQDIDLSAMVTKGQRKVEAFFHLRFSEAIHLTVASNRADFNKAFPAAWGMSQTECWMVGVGVADFLILLSPSAWKVEACDHDPKDSGEVQRIITHELVHVFHGQHNPSRDFTGADDIGWFVEGLGVLASGQLDRQRLLKTADAVRAGDVPKALSDAWSGPNRYGRAGSIVQYLDVKYGRHTLIALLPVVKQSDLLARLEISEDQLLLDWKTWLLTNSPPTRPSSTPATSSATRSDRLTTRR